LSEGEDEDEKDRMMTFYDMSTESLRNPNWKKMYVYFNYSHFFQKLSYYSFLVQYSKFQLTTHTSVKKVVER